MGVGGQRHVPGALTPAQWPGTRCIGGWVGPRAGMDGWGKSRPPPGFDPRTVHPVASRYTDWDIPAHCLLSLTRILSWIKQGSTNPGCQVTRTTTFWKMTWNICGLLVWNLLQVTELASGNFRWFLDFWDICAPWVESICDYMKLYVVKICSCLAVLASCNTRSFHLHYVLENSMS